MAADTEAKSQEDEPNRSQQEKTNGTQQEEAQESNSEDTEDSQKDSEQNAAATTIQRNYRGYRSRREMQGCGMSAEGRWAEILKDVQMHNLTAAKSKEDEDSGHKSRKWKTMLGVASRAGDNDDDVSGNDKTGANQRSEENNKVYWEKRLRSQKGGQEYSKTMGLEYWLELVDRKHRYGSNLTKYHAVWQKKDTEENFFYWLDEGEGKDEDLEECPRKKLEEQQLHYLTREQRYEYMIDVGDDGLLRWTKNGEKITTSAPNKDDQAATGAKLQETESNTHITDDLHNARGILQGAGHTVPTPLAKLIEMNQNKASWIFVIDTRFRIYAGIKESGTFQHSSFMRGSRVLSAGLISVQDGKMRSLSPHSGHYRPTAENFWITAKCLEAEGVDMSEASIAGSYTMLRGAEMYRDTLSYIQSFMSRQESESESKES